MFTFSTHTHTHTHILTLVCMFTLNIHTYMCVYLHFTYIHTYTYTHTHKSGIFAYITDTKNHVIRKVNMVSKEVTTLAGTKTPDGGCKDGPPGEALFKQPRGITV